MSSGIALGGGTGGPPSVIFRTPGQWADVAVCKVDERPWIDYATNKVKTTDEGKERTQDVVQAIAIGGTAVVSGGDDGDQALPVGDIVSFWIAGHRRWDFVQAQKKLGGLQVGDVMRVTYTGEEQGKGASPKKVWSFQMRRARDDEAAQTRRCVDVYNGAPPKVSLTQYGAEEPF